ncbi:CAMP factor family pore-forming toxin [Facklamia miroungae]|uniref:cAMP factor (Cfa) n=1 Tax=Facklamia miroungae TaxID=120956 RepID=A0A1G7PCM6_9LACT|nr:CAMP factor family pore-forming toxin [Facklamia miroungae]NKZ28665.1 CAMP factor family pore-forming toxin [Facklamia miroungae]SDF84055.1 CAMP factor (Cfa) [Facklamia miroungae]
MKKISIIFSSALLLSSVGTPLMQQSIYAQEAANTSQAYNENVQGIALEIVNQKEKLEELEHTVLGTPYEDLLNKSFDILETVISDATAIAKGEGINPETIYALNSIGPRLTAITEVIEAIDYSVNHLNNKIIDAHHMMGLKITHLTYTLLNPLSSNASIEKLIAELRETKRKAASLPDLSEKDTATIYSKAKLDKAIWNTRFIRDEKILGKMDADVYHSLNRAITKAVGIQLDPKSTVGEIDQAVAEIESQLKQALQGKIVEVTKRDRVADHKDDLLVIKDKEEQIKHLKEVLAGTNYESIIERASKLVENIKKEATLEASVAGKVPLKVDTIGSRIEALVTIIDGIVYATTEATNKVSDAHKDMGYTITKALITLADPFSSQASIDHQVQQILDLKEGIKNYPDLTEDDIATIYVKAKLDNAIWNTRFIRDKNILGKVPFEQYNDLNKTITKAVGVQLDPKSTVKDINSSVQQLQEKLQSILGYEVGSIVSKDVALPEIVKDHKVASDLEELEIEKDKLVKISERVLSKKYEKSLEQAFKLIDKLGDELDGIKQTDTVFALNTIGTRMNALKNIIESIDYATSELKNKDIAIHKEYGFTITRTLVALSDPFASKEKIEKRIAELLALEEKAANTPDLNLDSRANIYVQSILDEVIWNTRFRRDKEVLGKQPYEVYSKINATLTKAVGVQLNPNSTLRDVYSMINELESLFDDKTTETDEEIASEVIAEEETTIEALNDEVAVDALIDTDEETVEEVIVDDTDDTSEKVSEELSTNEVIEEEITVAEQTEETTVEESKVDDETEEAQLDTEETSIQDEILNDVPTEETTVESVL